MPVKSTILAGGWVCKILGSTSFSFNLFISTVKFSSSVAGLMSIVGSKLVKSM